MTSEPKEKLANQKPVGNAPDLAVRTNNKTNKIQYNKKIQ